MAPNKFLSHCLIVDAGTSDFANVPAVEGRECSPPIESSAQHTEAPVVAPEPLPARSELTTVGAGVQMDGQGGSGGGVGLGPEAEQERALAREEGAVPVVDLTVDIEPDLVRSSDAPGVVEAQRQRTSGAPVGRIGNAVLTSPGEAGPSGGWGSTIRQRARMDGSSRGPGAHGRPGAGAAGEQPSIPGPSRDPGAAPHPGRPSLQDFHKFFRRSNTGSNGLLFERSNYLRNRSIVAQEAVRAASASAAGRSVSSHIIRGGAPAAAPQGGPSPVRHAPQGRVTPADTGRRWRDGTLTLSGGIELTRIQSEDVSGWKVKMQKQYLGRMTKSVSDNRQGQGLFVSEWTARFSTELDAMLGLLYRLSFLQVLEIKLNLHNVTGTSMIKCFRDTAIRKEFPGHLDSYERIRTAMAGEIEDIFDLYARGTQNHADGISLEDILYSNTKRGSLPQNNVNQVRGPRCVWHAMPRVLQMSRGLTPVHLGVPADVSNVEGVSQQYLQQGERISQAGQVRRSRRLFLRQDFERAHCRGPPGLVVPEYFSSCFVCLFVCFLRGGSLLCICKYYYSMQEWLY